MDRDLVGYGETPPRVRWPDGARIAVNLVVNYEEGAENRLEDGCGRRETAGEVASQVAVDQRDLANESMFEYGSRAGVWRLLRIFDKHAVRATFFACAVALEKNPAVGRAITARGHDVLAHGNRWEEHFLLDREAERAAIERAVRVIEATTGQKPAGWYCRYGPSVNTRELVVASGHFLYDSDAYNDDLPYYVRVGGRPWLVVPYTLDSNDSRGWRGGLDTGADLFDYLRDSFDQLYEEGATHPRMLSVGLHCRIVGRPGRARGLDRFIAHARALPGVWFARRGEIARWWLEHHPPPSA
jgi:peptidoglycan/xylan/chitin deacetylase (PgdA/CDA1 family)